MNFIFLGEITQSRICPKCVDKSTVSRNGIAVRLFVPFLAEGRVRYPAACCDVYVMVGENHPRPKPTTIHFSCGPGPYFCIVTLVCTPVLLTRVPFNHISVGRSAGLFAAAPHNSFVVA